MKFRIECTSGEAPIIGHPIDDGSVYEIEFTTLEQLVDLARGCQIILSACGDHKDDDESPPEIEIYDSYRE